MEAPEKSRYSRDNLFTVCLLCTLQFTSALCVSLQAPFFPKEAEKKGSSAAEYGLVFGIYNLVTFAICPVLGKHIDDIGVKRIIYVGVVLAGLSAISFGLLDLINDHNTFIGLAYTVRIVEALGTSAVITGCYTITATVFHESIATVYAYLRGCYGVGFMVGPTLGGYLFELGGYMFPFLLLGCILLVEAVVIFFTLPHIDGDKNRKKNKIEISSVITLLPVFLDLFASTAVALSFGYNVATLEPHLRQFDLSPVSLGFVFIINAVTFAVTTPVIGFLCDNRLNPRTLIILGSVLIIISTCLVGPAPYLPLETTLWAVCLGLVVQGLGLACIITPSFVDGIHSAIACGMPDNLVTYGIVSGLMTSSFALGNSIGPSISGMLYDTVGFRKGTLFVVAIHAILFIAMTSYVCTRKKPARNKSNSGTSPNESGSDNLVTRWQHGSKAHALKAVDEEEMSDRCALIANGVKCNGYAGAVKRSDLIVTRD